MNKRGLSFILAFILFSATLVGCVEKEPLETFQEAIYKTMEVTKGQSETKVNFEGGKNPLRFTTTQIYDVSGDYPKIENHSLMQVSREGFGYSYYAEEGKQVLKLPFLSEFIILPDMTLEEVPEQISMEEFYTEIVKPTLLEWSDMLGEKDVVAGKKIILSTDEGDVKATEYTITLNSEQVKRLSQALIARLKNNKEMILYLAKKQGNEGLTEERLMTFLDKYETLCNEAILAMNMTAFIDIDGYIIDAQGTFTIEDDSEVTPESISISHKRWHMFKEQEFNMPTITEQNSIKLEEIEDKFK